MKKLFLVSTCIALSLILPSTFVFADELTTPYGTSIDVNTFISDVTLDIDNNYPVAGDAYEVVNGYHLVGHPNANIFHWFAIDGYSNYGSSTHYADSVHGASSISWSGNVPAYSTMDSSIIARIVDGRGIIW